MGIVGRVGVLGVLVLVLVLDLYRVGVIVLIVVMGR